MKKILSLFVTVSLSFAALAAAESANAAVPVTSTVNFGGDPTGIAFAADGASAYVADCENNLLKVVSLSTNQVSNVATVGTCPMSVVLSPDGKTAYVPNYWSQDVSVVDLTSQTVTATIPLAGSLFSIAISPDGTRLVVPNSIGTVFIIDTATNSVTQTVAVNDAPVYVAISPNSTTAYVTSANTPNLSVIDIASGVVTHTYGLNSGQVYGVTLTADGSKVFIAEFGGGSGTHVLQVDSASGTVDKTFEICAGPQIIKFSPDPNRLLVACNSGYLDVLNVETATVESTVTTQNGSRYVDVSSDGTKALVGNLDSHSLTVVSFNPALLPQVEPGRVVDKNAGSLAETGAAGNPVILLIGLVFVAVALLGVKTSRR